MALLWLLFAIRVRANYTVAWQTEFVDQLNLDPGTFQVKVLVQSLIPDAPLFVYLGNEAEIEVFYEMSGFLTNTLASTYNASVVFIEHRYYGDSIPSTDWQYLNSDQVLFDYASIITRLKASETTKVVVFGGSYGGMLAAFMRLKWPHIVDGALASSAPVLMEYDSGYGYMRVVSEVYRNYSSTCATNIHQGWTALEYLGSRPEYLGLLARTLKLCSPITSMTDVYAVEDWLTGAFAEMVQINYPYPANNLPGMPANVTCSYFSELDTSNPWNYVAAFAKVASLYYNSTEDQSCYEYSGGSSASPWEYQTCSEFLMPIGQNGITDIFPVRPFDIAQFSAYCNATYGTTPRATWEPINYGLFPDFVTQLQSASNIILSWGQLDPWNVGCIKDAINDSIYVYGIEDGAHHLDLRMPNAADPQSVVDVRYLETEVIRQWLA
jgi:lysosomal Pro-X carboxypeptidase